MDSQPFVKLIDIDITRETAPSLDIMRDLILEVVLPTWNSIAFYMKSNYPHFSKIFSFLFRKKIKQAHTKYLSGRTSSKEFSNFKTYRLLLYKIK